MECEQTMTDHADIVRKALNFTPDVVGNKPTRKDLAYRALDALVARIAELEARNKVQADQLSEERRAAEAERETINREWGVCASRMVAAEAEVKRLREALRVIAEWDCLNPPDFELCADHPWLKRHVDAALGEDA